MENRQMEIQECRRQIQALTWRVNALSARLDALEGGPAEAREATPVPAKLPKQEARPANHMTKYPNLESAVGKNLFAVLASVLVLLGVGVFISTIYEQIPQIVKIMAIYAFGFTLLGAGLVLYRKNKNNFWLGVASCGLSELLVSIITSHSYFEVLSLPATFVLVLVWIGSSFWLTRFHPTVFKTIGYIGFIISMLLGLNLLTDRDLVIYLTLVVAYAVLSVFFMVTNGSYVKMNTAMAFASIIGLCMFLNMDFYLPEGWDWVSGVIILAIAAVFHTVYLFRSKLSREAYPFYSIASLGFLSFFLSAYRMEVVIPAALCLVFVLWYVSYKLALGRTGRLVYTVFAGLYLFVVAGWYGSANWELFLWFAGFAVGSYALYYRTEKRDIAWLGLVCFALFYLSAGRYRIGLLVGTFAAALGFFTLNSSKWLRRDDALQTAWYVLAFCIAYSLKDKVQLELHAAAWDHRMVEEVGDGLFYTVYALVNTAYLHLALADRAQVMRITKKGIALMVIQGFVLINCLVAVDSRYWYVALLGVAASLLILSHSLWYSYKTSGSDRKLMVWQFVKFSLYCALVLTILDSPSILLNISLLLIAIGAVILGFRLGHKAVRVYGLVLSLVDVVCLVLFNIDFSDSLQLAGGIVLCGALCFVISFIYSRISKTKLLNQRTPEICDTSDEG